MRCDENEANMEDLGVCSDQSPPVRNRVASPTDPPYYQQFAHKHSPSSLFPSPALLTLQQHRPFLPIADFAPAPSSAVP